MSAEATITIPEKADQQTVIPGSVTDQDVDRVYNEFLDWTQWDNPNQRSALRTKAERKLAKIACRIQALQDEAEGLRKSIDVTEKKREAREFLNTAVQRFGTMGSPSVLMMVMKQRYPKRVKRTRPATEPATSSRTQTKPVSIAPKAETVVAPKAEPVATKDQPTAPKADAAASQPVWPNAQRQKVFDVLDKEGMSLKEIKDACRLPADVVKVVLANLLADQLVTVEGKGSTKSYRRATESS